MGFFNNIFGEPDQTANKKTTNIHWNALTDLQQLEDIAAKSFEKPVFIFKHSTRCSISRMALKQFETHYAITDEEATGYFLDLLEYRQISNEIASRFDVVHQSPQIILVKNGKCIYTASHSDIDAEELKVKIHEIKNPS